MPRLLIALTLLTLTGPALAKEVCKDSMMGRVCYEEGNELATSDHMKGNAVAEAKIKEMIKDKTKVADTKSAR